MIKEVYGIIHLPPLPNSLRFKERSIHRDVDFLVKNISILRESGFTGCLIQNSDVIYSIKEQLDPVKISYLTKLLLLVIDRLGKNDEFRIGIQIMWNHAIESIALAKICQLDFVKIAGFLGESTSAYGTYICDPYSINKYILEVGAQEVDIYTEVFTDHFYWKPEFLSWNQIANKHLNNNSNGICLANIDTEKILNILTQIDSKHTVYITGYVTSENIDILVDRASGIFISGIIKDNVDCHDFSFKKCKYLINRIKDKYEILN